MSVILILLVSALIIFFLYQIVLIIRKLIEKRKQDAIAKAQADNDDGTETEMTNDLRSLRLPKDAVMVRNPLFDARSPEHKEEFDYEDFEETGK